MKSLIVKKLIDFKSPLQVIFLMKRTFKKQPDKLFKNIEENNTTLKNN